MKKRDESFKVPLFVLLALMLGAAAVSVFALHIVP